MRVTVWIAAFLLAGACSVAAQEAADLPGPYVLDLRGALTGVPGAGAFFPPSDSTQTISVPSRAFGFDVGGHVYPFALGLSRVGFGVNLVRARGSLSNPDVSVVVTTVAPQISFNFGTADGWSYLSAGYGAATVTSNIPGADGGSADSEILGSVNLGGGARWFLRRRLAAGFDVRFHMLGKGSVTPRAKVIGVSVGVSVR